MCVGIIKLNRKSADINSGVDWQSLLGPFLWPKKIDNMTLSFREYDFIWPNKNDWARTYNYSTKMHYQRK